MENIKYRTRRFAQSYLLKQEILSAEHNLKTPCLPTSVYKFRILKSWLARFLDSRLPDNVAKPAFASPAVPFPLDEPHFPLPLPLDEPLLFATVTPFVYVPAGCLLIC